MSSGGLLSFAVGLRYNVSLPSVCRKIHLRAVTMVPLALMGAVWAQSSAAPNATSSIAPALHAWPKAEVLEDLSPATLARLAAERREREEALANGSHFVASSAASNPNQMDPPPAPPRSHYTALPPAPSNSEVTFAAPPKKEDRLIATLQPLQIGSGSQHPYLARNSSNPYEPEVARFPYSPGQKFHLFWKNVYDPFGLISESFDALYSQAEGNPHDYGGGMEGYGKRLGAIKATDIAGEFTGTFLFPSLLRTDPRYFRMGHGSFFKRAGYALTRTLITKNDSGGNTFNAANFLSGISTTAISNSYYPHRDRSFPGIMQHASINIGFDSLSNLFNEFWPDIGQRLHVPAFIVRRTADPYFPDQK